MNSQQLRYGNTIKWQSPSYKGKRVTLQLNEARRKLCPKSPFWHQDLDLEAHKAEWNKGSNTKMEFLKKERDDLVGKKIWREELGLPVIIASIPTAFGGKEFEENLGNVLALETIFCPQWQVGKEEIGISPWPNKHEMEYEGDGRIATDRLHRRFPGAPRVPANDTVNWQHRAVIPQYAFEDFYYPIPSVVDIFMRTHRIGDSEFSDEEGMEAVGQELMGLLDPKDQWI